MRRFDMPVLPQHTIVLAGDWGKDTANTDRPELSLETRMRIGALAAGVRHHAPDGVDTVFYTGGLLAQGVPEAEGMLEYTREEFPDVAKAVHTFRLDNDCHDTSTSASNVHEMVVTQGITGRIGFITSLSHMARALKTFQRKGFEAGQLVPISAEQLLMYGNVEQQKQAEAYLRSPRYFKRVGIEVAARGLALVDSDYAAARKLAGMIRPNRATNKPLS